MPKSLQLSQPESGERRAGFAVNVLPQFQLPTAAPADDKGQVVVLVGGAVAHASSECEDRIVEQ